jgi:UDP-N-acetylmuramyl pentapeptide phosphotransferase/UDP-N-acetylglucosamine-1-phosphate transferase
METGSLRKVITLLVGILIAFFIANAISNAIVLLAGLKGPAGMVVSFVVYVVIFFFVLHLLEKYAHIVFFGFGRE